MVRFLTLWDGLTRQLLPSDVCADCKTRNPRWASHNLGVFVCVNCASIHRKMGTHISKIKSITLDSWTKEQVESMKAMGNLKSNAVYNSNETRHPPPPALADPENDVELESYIRSKYQYKKFIDKSALVALKLGPSRSAVNASTSRSASTPVGNQKALSSSPIPSSSSVPSVIGKSTETPVPSLPPGRPPTVHPTWSARTASQPVPQAAHAEQRKDDMWSDLISLQDSARDSSLPLQYQAIRNMNQSGLGLGASATSNMYTSSLQTASPIATTSYHQLSFPQTPSFSPTNAFIHPTPLYSMPTGFVMNPTTPQFQQQFLQPQPIPVGPSMSGPQPMIQQPQFTTPSPIILSTPSPAIGSFVNPSPHLPTPSPTGIGYTQTYSTVTVNQPGVMMTGAPQMQMTMPMQLGAATGFMQPQGHMGYATSAYQTQTGFGNTSQHQWGPL
ncbi:hypothetical protein AX15_000368 [Amanita polypyramis BW_CC]|nr:hypothetical protein AX15_000368 [Amanita polypyramis BW_CC]